MNTKDDQKNKRQSLFPRTDSAAYCGLGSRTWSRLNASGKMEQIGDVLAGLLFDLQDPHLTSSERAMVLDSIDRLIRFRIDLG